MYRKVEEEEESEIQNKGRVLLDATGTPADIKYPTDIDLLNQVRQETEKVIDILHKYRKERLEKKPKTYRKKARKEYLAVVKKRRISRKARRKAVKKQLQYIKRNLQHLDNFIEKEVSLEELSYRQYKRLLIANEIYRQQELMWSNNTDRIDDRTSETAIAIAVLVMNLVALLRQVFCVNFAEEGIFCDNSSSFFMERKFSTISNYHFSHLTPNCSPLLCFTNFFSKPYIGFAEKKRKD